MDKYIYKIMVNEYGGPFDRARFTGIAFKDESTAREYIQKFEKKSNRGYYSIEKEKELVPYGSIDELIKDNPKKELARLEVLKDDLINDIRLPFYIRFILNDKVQDINVITIKDLKNIIRELNNEISYLVEELGNDIIDIYKKADKTISFTLPEINGFNYYSIEGNISINHIEDLDQIYANILEKLEKIGSDIKTYKNSMAKEDENE